MKKLLLICTAAASLTGCTSSALPECDFSIEGDALKWEGSTFHIGKTLCVDGQKLVLPEKVNEMNCSAWKADFNGDGEPDYLLSVAGMGNGRNFGNGVLYIFLSGSKHYQCLKQKYGGFLQ